MSFTIVKLSVFLLVLKYAIARSTSEIDQNQAAIATATTELAVIESSTKTRYEKGLEDYEEAEARQGRGMMMDDDHDDFHDHDDHHQEQKAVKEDPWAGYYDFIINEGSFKFWAAFQLITAVLLIYSALAAVYYAKFNVITSDYDYYDDFFGRSNSAPSVPSSTSSLWSGLSSQTFQRIFDALSSKKYS